METYEELKAKQAELEKEFAEDYRELNGLELAIKNARSQEEYDNLSYASALKTSQMGHEGKMVSIPAEYVFAEWDKKFGGSHA